MVTWWRWWCEMMTIMNTYLCLFSQSYQGKAGKSDSVLVLLSYCISMTVGDVLEMILYSWIVIDSYLCKSCISGGAVWLSAGSYKAGWLTERQAVKIPQIVGMASGSSIVVPMVLWGRHAPTHCISAILMTPDMKHVVTGCNDGQICIWDVADNWQVSHHLSLSSPPHVHTLHVQPSLSLSGIRKAQAKKVFVFCFLWVVHCQLMYRNVSLCTGVSVCVQVCQFAYRYVSLYTCLSACVQACQFVYSYAGLYTGVSVCVQVCQLVYICTDVSVCVQVCQFVYRYVCVQVCQFVYRCVHAVSCLDTQLPSVVWPMVAINRTSSSSSAHQKMGRLYL